MSTYTVRYLETSEITEDQWSSYHRSFSSVFDKGYSIDYLKKKYAGTCLGYSFHGVLFHHDQIVGMYTALPRNYFFFDKEIIIAQGCDAFILPEHRKDESFLKQMFDIVVMNLQGSNIKYHISLPNKTAYPYWKTYVDFTDIGTLDYFVIPLRVGNVIGRLRFLNNLSFLFFKFITAIGPNFYNTGKCERKEISLKRDDSFFSERYGTEYNIRTNHDGSGFVYLIYNEDGVRTAYLVDCFPLSKGNIAIALRQIIRENGRKIDVVIFVGKIDEQPLYFLKVPKSREPRKQPFIGFFSGRETDKRFFDIAKWEVSLANFDNR